jgi:hypothetical protein
MTRTVCIVGYAQETRDLANSQPDDVELWGMNVNHKFMKRWDRWFQLHPPVWKGHPFYGRSLEHVEFLKTCDVPLFMRYPNPEFPTAVEYPLEDVRTSLGRPYITSTAANMIGLAIHEEVDEIRLFGVNMSSNSEYVDQRPCVEWMLGLAEGRGIKVEVPSSSPVLNGADYPGELLTDSVDVAQTRLDVKRQTYNKYWARVHNAAGAIEAIKQIQANASTTEEVLKEWQEWGQAMSQEMNMAKGQVVESKYWLAQTGSFDRHASVMPLQHVPKDVFPPEMEERLGEAIIKGEVPVG